MVLNINNLYKAYELLKVCKLNKLADDDKLRMWRILKAFKPVYEKFDDEMKMAVEKFKPYDGYSQKLEKAQAYETLLNQGVTETLPMTTEEYNSFVSDYQKYNELVERAISEYGEQEMGFELECLSEEAFGNLMASNDWNAEQVIFLDEILTE